MEVNVKSWMNQAVYMVVLSVFFMKQERSQITMQLVSTVSKLNMPKLMPTWGLHQ